VRIDKGWKVGRVGGLFCHMKEVKEIFNLIYLNDNVSIIDKKRCFKFLEW
jgi:hypothetical protein